MRWLLLLLLLAAPLAAQQRTPVDYALASAATGLLLADWSQTLQIARTPWRIEHNPLLGPRPSVGRVNTLLSLEVLATGATILLPKAPRRATYLVIILLETWTVNHNLHAGLSVGF